MVLDPNHLVAALNAGRAYWGDFAEIFAERRTDTMIVLDDGRLDQVSAGEEAGLGVRVFSGKTSAYVYTTDFSRAAIVEALRLAHAATRQRAAREAGQTLVAALEQPVAAEIRHDRLTELFSLGEAEAFRAEHDALTAIATSSRVPEALWIATGVAAMRAITEGRFAEVAADHAVQEAYMGRRAAA